MSTHLKTMAKQSALVTILSCLVVDWPTLIWSQTVRVGFAYCLVTKFGTDDSTNQWGRANIVGNLLPKFWAIIRPSLRQYLPVRTCSHSISSCMMRGKRKTGRKKPTRSKTRRMPVACTATGHRRGRRKICYSDTHLETMTV